MHRLIVLVAIFLSGCSSTTKITKPFSPTESASFSNIEVIYEATSAPKHFTLAVQSYLEQELRNNNAFSDDSQSKVTIQVVNYRMRSGFSRAMVGIFAGKDGIDSEVVVTNAVTGDVIGKSNVSSFNMTAIGGMDDVAKMHAKEIARFLLGEKK